MPVWWTRRKVLTVTLQRRKQMLGKFIPFNDFTRAQVAQALGTDKVRLNNLIHGGTYPTPNECDVLEKLFGLPVQVLFDKEMLEYRYDWPPPRGIMTSERLRKKAGE